MGVWNFFSRLVGGSAAEALSAGLPAPAFALKGIDGKSYDLTEALQQGPVLLAFFKENCPTCQFTFPFLERIQQAVKDNNSLQVWGISQSDATDTRAFAEDLGLTFPLLLDEDDYPVSNQYSLTNVPTLFLVGPDGTIRVSSIGFNRQEIEAIAKEFSRVKGEPLSVFQPHDIVPDYKPG